MPAAVRAGGSRRRARQRPKVRLLAARAADRGGAWRLSGERSAAAAALDARAAVERVPARAGGERREADGARLRATERDDDVRRDDGRRRRRGDVLRRLRRRREPRDDRHERESRVARGRALHGEHDGGDARGRRAGADAGADRVGGGGRAARGGAGGGQQSARVGRRSALLHRHQPLREDLHADHWRRRHAAVGRRAGGDPHVAGGARVRDGRPLHRPPALQQRVRQPVGVDGGGRVAPNRRARVPGARRRRGGGRGGRRHARLAGRLRQ